MSNEALPNDIVNIQTSAISNRNDDIEIDIADGSPKRTSLSMTLGSEKPTTSTADDVFTINDFEIPTTTRSSDNGHAVVDSQGTSRFFEGPSTSTAHNSFPEFDLKDQSTSTVTTFSNDIESGHSDNPNEGDPLLNHPAGDGNGNAINEEGCRALVSTVFNLVLVIVGALNLDKCEVLKLASLYLMIIGMFGIILKPIAVCCGKYSRRLAICFMCIISLIELAWLIFISYWVYSANPDFDPANPSYCNKVAYYLAFWMLTLYWIFIGLVISSLCCLVFVSLLVSLRMKQ